MSMAVAGRGVSVDDREEGRATEEARKERGWEKERERDVIVEERKESIGQSIWSDSMMIFSQLQEHSKEREE